MRLRLRDAVLLPHMRVLAHPLPLSLLALLGLAACATPRTPGAAQTPAQRVREADRMVRGHDYQGADRILRGVIDSPDFQTLDPAQRHQALLLGARTALQLDDPERRLSLLKRACEFPQAGSVDWSERVRAAYAARDSKDAGAALVVLAMRWPETLPQFESSGDFGKYALAGAVWALQKSGSDADRYTVLRALFEARFPKPSVYASGWWQQLALLQLEHGERAAAVATLSRVTNPYVVICIEADKRFDPIRSQLSLDVGSATEQAIAAALTEVQTNPASLRPMIGLMYLLRHSLRFEQALRVADLAIERQEAEGPTAYEDYEDEYVWVLNDRAYALFGLGRWDAAVIQMETASRMSESGDPNVSQTLNLALMYADLGRPEETLAALKRVERASAYGDTVRQDARLRAAVQLHDTNAVNEALQFLSEHREDSIGGYQGALLYADREEEGAKLLISRLADPALRSGALLAIQQWGQETMPPQVVLVQHRWQALMARHDVQEAIRAVGYVKRYSLVYDDY